MKSSTLSRMQEESRKKRPPLRKYVFKPVEILPDLMKLAEPVQEWPTEATIGGKKLSDEESAEAARRLFGLKTGQKSELEKGIDREKVRLAAIGAILPAKKEPDVDYDKVRAAASRFYPREAQPTPDAPKKIQRQRGVYSNTTPYGIAKEVHG